MRIKWFKFKRYLVVHYYNKKHSILFRLSQRLQLLAYYMDCERTEDLKNPILKGEYNEYIYNLEMVNKVKQIKKQARKTGKWTT